MGTKGFDASGGALSQTQVLSHPVLVLSWHSQSLLMAGAWHLLGIEGSWIGTLSVLLAFWLFNVIVSIADKVGQYGARPSWDQRRSASVCSGIRVLGLKALGSLAVCGHAHSRPISWSDQCRALRGY